MPEWLDPAMISQQNWPSFHEGVLRLHMPEHPSDVKVDAPPRMRLMLKL